MKTDNGQMPDPVPQRPPEKVMRLARLGSFHQSRLSFMRVLLRKMKLENWTVERPICELDDKGVGVVTYRCKGPDRTYTLIAFAHDLPAEKRSDRVIADAWDATFTLYDGEPDSEDIERLSRNVPLQEAGRITETEFVLSRANKSVRLFDYVRDCLARGEQPEAEKLDDVGYLMRTTAVYGSGKFGAADRSKWAGRNEFKGSFQPELMAVWLVRCFASDWVEHMARVQGGEKAVALSSPLKRRLGIGNSTGLGMAPFLIKHPALIHSWINAREAALARVRNIETVSDEEISSFTVLVKRALKNAMDWHSQSELQIPKIKALREDLQKLLDVVQSDFVKAPRPWDALYEWSEENLSLEGQEQTVSLLIEPHGSMVDSLAESMSADEIETFRIDGSRTTEQVLKSIHKHYGWAKAIAFDSKPAQARVWYVSAEKLEPRLGERFEEDIEAYEQALAPARDAMRLRFALLNEQPDETMAMFLLHHPEHRHVVRRLQVLDTAPYGELRDNTIDEKMLPIDLLRCKLSFFGATKFDPKSDRWVRITMYQHAPYPDEIEELDPDDCFLPGINP
ncbi:MAG: hypothetical protein QNJ29_07785 [Rhizobiaceae bacterium]|nr:hypothetical protein [Rhizobiaceae bacterium]